IISTLFKRGSFDIKSVEVSASLLKYLALSLPFTAIISIASNLYMSAQQIKIPILYQIFSNVIQVALIGLSVSWAGYIGYPIALLTMSILNVLVIYLFFTRLFPFIRYESILRYLIIMIGVHTILILCLKLILKYTFHINEIILIVVAGSVYVAALIFLSFRLKLNTDFNNFISNTWGRLSSAKKP
ncbi:MAG TPA: lipid II flippase MurJ, partial [Flavitalea sp.]|nr:lipid II flippase MurJ [Flavitalea sp.]